MYLVGNGAFLEVSIKGRMDDQRILSFFHYRYDTIDVPIDGAGLIDTFNPLFNGAAAPTVVKAYTDVTTTGVLLEEVVYQWIQPTRRARVSKIPAVAAGSVIGDQLPCNLAVALTKKSETAGRHGHGTLHLPGILTDFVVSSRLTLLGADSYGPLLDALFKTFDLVGGAKMVPVIYNRTNPDTSVPITTAQVEQTVRTMHRRTVGVGE